MSMSITTMGNGAGSFASSWPSAAVAAFSSLARAIADGLARKAQRRALREIAEDGDHHILRDIGLMRCEAYREAAKWFWQR
jgi:uncharacterized protein YjiS (DUF1127 family)